MSSSSMQTAKEVTMRTLSMNLIAFLSQEAMAKMEAITMRTWTVKAKARATKQPP